MDSAECRLALRAWDGAAADAAALRRWQDTAAPDAQLAAAATLLATAQQAAARRCVQQVEASTAATAAQRIAAAALRFELGDFGAALAALDQLGHAAAAADAATTLQLAMRLASRIGWHRDGIESAARAVELQPACAAAVCAHLWTLLAAEGHPAKGLEQLQALQALVPPSAERAWAAASLCSALGRLDEVRSHVDRALALDGGTAPAQRRAAQLLLDAGDFAGALRQLDALLLAAPQDGEALLLLGQLHLWRGDLAAASAARHAAAGASTPLIRRQGAAALLLQGRASEALQELDAVLAADAANGEALLWRAEALLDLGRLAEAEGQLDAHPRRGDWTYWPLALLRSIVALRRRGAVPRSLLARVRRRLTRERAAFAGSPTARKRAHYELYWALHALLPDADAALASRDPVRQLQALEAARRALRGNRSARPTTVCPDGALIHVPLRSPRDACVRALSLLKTAPPREVLDAFDQLIAEYADSSLPRCYRGELHLWLGNYEAAHADLTASIGQRPTTRWAYYGLAAHANVSGAPQRALALCARSVRVLGDEGLSIYIHRGEALRRLGRTEAARAELRRACALAPTRLSGPLNLALADGDAGDVAAERDGVIWLRDQAPGLLSDAAAALRIADWADAEHLPRDAGRALLEEALRMMRGNRASSFATWLSPRGVVRVAGATAGGPSAWQRFQADAPERRRTLRDLLQRALETAR